jgi:hypothetical protein
MFVCECGKDYEQRQGLNKHKRTKCPLRPKTREPDQIEDQDDEYQQVQEVEEIEEIEDRQVVIQPQDEELRFRVRDNDEHQSIVQNEEFRIRVRENDEPVKALPKFTGNKYKSTEQNGQKLLFLSPNIPPTSPTFLSPIESTSTKTVMQGFSPRPVSNTQANNLAQPSSRQVINLTQPQPHVNHPQAVKNNNSNDQDFTTCEHLQQAIEQLLFNRNLEEARQIGKLVVKNPQLYQNYLNKNLTSSKFARDEKLQRRTALAVEMKINGPEVVVMEAEFRKVNNLTELEHLINLKKYNSEHLLYEMRYNEQFSKAIPAMEIMQEWVTEIANFDITHNFDTGLNPSDIKEMLATSEKKAVKKIHKKIIVIVAVVVFVVIFCCVFLVFYSWVDLVMLITLIGSAVFIFKHKDAIVDAVN